MFEILILMYGDYVDLASRCISSIIDNSSKKDLKIHVGLNSCGLKTKSLCRSMVDDGLITTLIDSNPNLHKDQMMRQLIGCVQSRYFVWFDDDSYINKYDWNSTLNNILINNSSYNIFGFIHTSYRDSDYIKMLQDRPWFNYRIQLSEKIIFPTGGLWVAEKSYLVKHNYPDSGMNTRLHQHVDDRLLGDMIKITNGKLYSLPEWDSTFCVSKSTRRGPEITN